MKPEDIKYIILHTAAHGYRDDNKTGHSYNTTMADIRKWHTSPPRNYRKEGYHGLIRLDGKFEPGRKLDEIGAHSTPPGKFSGINSYSLGLCFAGHGDYTPWTEEQKKTGIAKIAEWCLKFNVPVTNVLGHRELGSNKTCPGTLINMDDVRAEVHRAMVIEEEVNLPISLKWIVTLGFKLLYRGFNTYPNPIQNRLNLLRHQDYFGKTLDKK